LNNIEGLTGRNKQEYQYDKTTVYTSREKMEFTLVSYTTKYLDNMWCTTEVHAA
jgi:chitodextrinase